MARLKADEPFVHPDCIVNGATFGRYVEIGRGSRISDAEFGDYSYCDRYCDVASATIGRFASIAAFVRIGAPDHPLDRASMHHFMYRSADLWDNAADDDTFFAHRRSRRVSIGNDTWLGHAAIIKPAVKIGHGAVVAAGAVVTEDVAHYTIVGGVPARKIRERQPPAIAERLVALGWWNWDHDRLHAALDDFRLLSAEAFLDKHGG